MDLFYVEITRPQHNNQNALPLTYVRKLDVGLAILYISAVLTFNAILLIIGLGIYFYKDY